MRSFGQNGPQDVATQHFRSAWHGGRKSALRFDGRGNNLKFGAASFFVTPNFAYVYHPLVLQLLEGPGKWSHLDIRGAAAVRAGGITSAAPTMPPLERMHQIVAPP